MQYIIDCFLFIFYNITFFEWIPLICWRTKGKFRVKNMRKKRWKLLGFLFCSSFSVKSFKDFCHSALTDLTLYVLKNSRFSVSFVLNYQHKYLYIHYKHCLACALHIVNQKKKENPTGNHHFINDLKIPSHTLFLYLSIFFSSSSSIRYFL